MNNSIANTVIARRLEEVAWLLEEQHANPYRVHAYRQAAALVRQLPDSVAERWHREGPQALRRLPGIGESLARSLQELVLTGRLPILERLRGEVDSESLLASVPGIGRVLAARRGRDEVTMSDFDEAADRVIAGLEKKSRVINPREKAIIAHHEIGHALTAELLPHVDPVRKVSIIPRGVAALGYTQQLPTEDRYLMTRSELEDRLAVLLGGRGAEELIFTDISTGAQDDLQKATDIARRMVTEYGMRARLGLRTFEHERRGIFLETSVSTQKDYSEKKAAEIDKEVEEILAKAHRQVQELLTANKPLLEKLASLLLEKEVLEGEELRRIIRAATDGADGAEDRRTIH